MENVEHKLNDLQEKILKITNLYGTSGNNQKKQLHKSFNSLKKYIQIK